MTVVGVPCPRSRQRFRQHVPYDFRSVVGEGTFDDEQVVDRGDGAIGQEPSEGLDAVGGPVGQVQEGPLDDLLALAFSFSQEDGRS